MADDRQQAGRSSGLEEVGHLPDEALLAQLHDFGMEPDQATLADWCAKALSAREIAEAWERHERKHHRAVRHSERLWRCLATLWQRWCPEIPSFEGLNAKMQDGYERLAAGDGPAACRIWLDAWRDVLLLLEKPAMPTGMSSIEKLDARFRGTHPLLNWIQDLETELWNAGLQDPQFLTARIEVCEEGLRRFPTDDALLTENRRRALAESYARLGEPGKADALYREWLTADPQWGWGWIGWSDNYQFINTVPDVARAEQLLQEGRAVPDVRDRPELLERLADLYDEQGRRAEAKALWRDAKAAAEEMEITLDVSSWGTVPGHKTTITFGGAGLPLSELPKLTDALRGGSASAPIGRHKIGRNDPCPCGSGKKFKKCCGRGPAPG